MRLHRWLLTLAAGFWVFAGPVSPVKAQEEKDITLTGQVKVGVHSLKLDDKVLYELEVKAKGFMPQVQLLGQYIPNTANVVKDRHIFRGFFFPKPAKDHVLVIMPVVGLNPPEGLLDYSVKLKAMKLSDTPLLKMDDRLTSRDPRYANPKQTYYTGPYKEYPLQMKAGQLYVIEMSAVKGGTNELFPYVIVEDSNNTIVSQDLTNPTARVILRPTADGKHRIIAATSVITSVGSYTLTVRTLKDEK